MLPQQLYFVPGVWYAVDPAGHEDTVWIRHDGSVDRE